MTRRFFDSNVLLYAINSDDRRGPRAAELLRQGGVISVQCLNEFASVARRKLHMAWPGIRESLAQIRSLCAPVVAVDETIHGVGLNIAERYKLSVYDAMIVAAALSAGCETLYSEDMHAGLVVDGRLTIADPFA